MARWLVVAVCLWLYIGSTHIEVSAQACDTSQVEVNKGCLGTLLNKTYSAINNKTETLCIQPESNFKGVNLKVKLKNEVKEAWFNVDECYQERSQKWIVLIMKLKARHNQNIHDLKFDLTIGMCTKQCSQNISGYYIRGFSVQVDGSLRWMQARSPDQCLSRQPHTQKPQNFIQTSCTGSSATTAPVTHSTTTTKKSSTTTIPTANTTTTTDTATSSPASGQFTKPVILACTAAVVAVVVAVVMVVMVAVCYKRRRNGHQQEAEQVLHHHQDPTTPGAEQIEVVENDIYEPFGGSFAQPASVPQETEVVENDIYEPFGGSFAQPASVPQETQVVENDIYEPFGGSFAQPASVPQETEVVENDIYEPFGGSFAHTNAVEQEHIYSKTFQK